MEWNPAKYRCKACGTIIFSRYVGEFSQCKCPGDTWIAVDQTKYYSRHLGNPDQFEEVKENV